MLTRLRVGTPAGLSLLFVLLAGIPLAALGWLGSRLLAQERDLERQQRRELLRNTAALLTHEIDRSLLRWEEAAAAGIVGDAAPVPSLTVLLVFDERGVLRERGVRLPYVPALASEPPVHNSALSAAAVAEHQGPDLGTAEKAYRTLASATPDRSTRAAALLGLGRTLRKQAKLREAIAAYEELAAMRDVPAAGFPAELVARRELRAIFHTAGDEQSTRREAERLTAALTEGRFRIDRATFDIFAESLAPPETAALALSDAVGDLWPIFQQQAEGRRTMAGRGRTMVAVWRRRADVSAAIVGPADSMMATVSSLANDLGVAPALEDSTGRPVWGTAVATDTMVSHSLREFGLP